MWFEFVPDHGGREIRRYRDITAQEIAENATRWGALAYQLLKDEWISRDFGEGYYQATIQHERGLFVLLLGEAGQRV
ncbi:hypothetical protein FB471_4474 [Amycolatopsis cihanbeyliensis]|uniref:Uncharacterized protein n=1 Tax=Amycolatopsis cihanbeyliensis TaxID=1128664 RepID=A0A542DNI8_AMYCI|nr:hypothetical protein FB471_4474 [Amycolatopsis cihanbeyliensis]